jgi:hypothetical protein
MDLFIATERKFISDSVENEKPIIQPKTPKKTQLNTPSATKPKNQSKTK